MPVNRAQKKDKRRDRKQKNASEEKETKRTEFGPREGKEDGKGVDRPGETIGRVVEDELE